MASVAAPLPTPDGLRSPLRADPPLLCLEDAGRTYDDGHPVHALRSATVVIEQGEYVAITGPSGSGKSTLLNLLGLLDVPSHGTYRIHGTTMTGLDEATLGAIRGQLFGFVFQAFHLLPGRTAAENVELGMLYGPHRRQARRRRAADVLARVGLASRAGTDPRKLSGGERQRVAIARAVAAGPRVLFCDEPTGNLDSVAGENLLALLRDLHRDGLTIVVVTHDRTVAAQGDRQLHVIDGVVAEC